MSRMITCPSCGKTLDKSANVCPNCGRDLYQDRFNKLAVGCILPPLIFALVIGLILVILLVFGH